MGLETGTYIDSLDAANPVHATDQVSEGDDHIRLIKSVILATFPNITGAVTSTHTELNYNTGTTGTTGSGLQVLAHEPTLTGDCNITGTLTATSWVRGSLDASDIAADVVGDAYISQTSVTQHQAALAITESQVSDLGSYLSSGDVATTLSIGNADTTLSRIAAGQLEVEGAPVITHNDAALTSGKVFFSSTTEPTTEGNNGDIFLVY